ncbi:unnamed protein product [Rangifer tarandus platyrhynchus]|uniref:Uncharacterized protein n=1 Tax=Rangifer tarandus platyrhynchus TaxID=3082113 RepID=A0AC59ZAI5_RANTA
MSGSRFGMNANLNIFTWQSLDDTKCQRPPFQAWVPLFVSQREGRCRLQEAHRARYLEADSAAG